MDLTALLDLTRRLAGDPKFEDNTLGWEDSEIVEALNWAQTRYAEATHCTYREVAASGATASDGIFTVPPGFILVDRVMIPDPVETGPNATITTNTTTANNVSASASVAAQTGASYFWTVAGGSLTTGQGGNAITFLPMAVPGAVVTLSCVVQLNGQMDFQSVDVVLT